MDKKSTDSFVIEGKKPLVDSTEEVFKEEPATYSFLWPGLVLETPPAHTISEK